MNIATSYVNIHFEENLEPFAGLPLIFPGMGAGSSCSERTSNKGNGGYNIKYKLKSSLET
jgi:hypothetical protein